MRRINTRPQESSSAGASQKINKSGDVYNVVYGFRNFNNDNLSIDVKIPEKDVKQASDEFGFNQSDFIDLDEWYEEAQESAIAATKKKFITGSVSASSQAELDRKMAQIKAQNARLKKDLDDQLNNLADEYRRRRVELYTKGGFRYKDKKTVEVDIPSLVRRNAKRMSPAALAFSRLAKDNGYGMEELIGAVTSMAQTALRYEIPSSQEGDKTISGVLPPPKSFTMGQGDCDTKSALIGSILLNWPNIKLVGLGIPEHYLLAVHRIPGRGDVYIEYEGVPYVMIEAAGPGWLAPGKVGETTDRYLASGKSFAIQPF